MQAQKTLDDILGRPGVLGETTKLASLLVLESRKLPKADELSFYRGSTSLGQNLDLCNNAIVKQMTALTAYINGKRDKISKDSTDTVSFPKMTYFLDDLYENIDATLDSWKMGNGNTSEMVIIKKSNARGIASQDQLTIHDDSLKPQNYFSSRVDNSDVIFRLSKYPFIPIIKLKHNSTIPLDNEILKARSDPEAYFNIFLSKGDNLSEYEFNHPYQQETESLTIPEEMLSLNFEAKEPGPENDETFTYVDSWSALNEMMEHLRKFKEIAFDLEHHSYRSFQGITCLIQVSTRERDFIIDAIALRDHLPVLNEITSDPQKLKVFHGANMDVKWLQRDFGVYVVNLFDTYQAVSQLGRPPFTFASLLFRYTKKVSDKELQLADWRIRPLTQSMIKYARRDTHYLLYIYDCLKIDLINKATEAGKDPKESLVEVWDRSKGVSLIQYAKPNKFNRSYYTIYNNQKFLLGDAKLAVFKKLWEWRYNKARELDESTEYILENSLLCKIAATIPQGTAELLKVKKNFPEKCKLHAKAIVQLICKTLNSLKEREENGDDEYKVAVKTTKRTRMNDLASNNILLQEDTTIKTLAFEISEMKIEGVAPQTEGCSRIELFVHQPPMITNKDSKFSYKSHFDFLKELYPGMAEKADFSDPNNMFTLKHDQDDSHLLNVATSEFMEFQSTGDNPKAEKEALNIQKMLSIPALPQSLKDRFSIDLMNKTYIKKEEKRIKKKLAQKKVVTAKHQESNYTGNIFQTDIVSALKSKKKTAEETAGAAEISNTQGASFWDTCAQVEKDAGQQRRKKELPVFGLYNPSTKIKKVVKKSKFGKSKQPKNFKL